MKKTCMFIICSLYAISFYGQEIIAAWTFDNLTDGNYTAKVISSNGEWGQGTIYADGTNGSDDWNNVGSYEINALSGTILNDPRDSTSASMSLVLSNITANGKSIVFKFSMTGTSNLRLSYAQRGSSTGFTSETWSYSLDGVSFSEVVTISGTNVSEFTLREVNLSTITSLNNADVVYLKLTLDGCIGVSGNNRIDNVVFHTDTSSPEITLFEIENPTTLKLVFNETLSMNTAQNTSNYFIEGRTITNATLQGNVVTLTVTPSLTTGITNTMYVSNVEDLSGNVMLPDTLTFSYLGWDGTHAPWTHGTGTESDPFLIENAQQLAYLAYRVNNGLDAGGGHVSNHDLYYKLMTDVNLNGRETFQWTPIGYWISETNYYSFGGHFDGNNHTVSGLYINSTANRVGFFGYTDGATIKNLSVAGDTIATTGQYAGGVVGCAWGKTKIINCSNKCNIGITSVGGFSGGIVASASELTINKCYNTGIINHCNIANFAYENTIKGMSGGIIGMVDSYLDVKHCYNTGYMNGTVYALVYRGGIVGYCDSTTSVSITCCFNIGDVELFDSNNGGNAIVGVAVSPNAITNCYYLMYNHLSGFFGGIPLTEAEMKNPEFVSILNNGSCAWEQDVSPYDNDGYPILTMIIQEAYTEPATDVMAFSATLNGSIIMENVTITSKGFEYREQGDSSFIAVNVTGNDNSFSYMLNGLTPNTTYEYRTFVNVAECPYTSYGDIQIFEVSWLNADTILIYDADMLQWVSDRCNSGTSFEGKYIKLMNNIVLPLNQPNNMTSIGTYPNYPFKGTFDGNGMQITNLYIDQPNTPYQGFFGYTQNAYLYEVGLVNITASGRNYTGGMVAYAENTYMRDCYVSGGTLFALSYCGGLVGYQSEGTNSIISGCYNTCTVSGTSYVGGLVGFSNYATVRNSYVASSVAAQGSAVGAIIGGANEVLMYNCYFSTQTTGQTNAIGEHNFRDGEGLTNAEMQNSQFVATLNQGLVTPVWKADYATPINNGFPILIWQYSDVETCEAPTNLSYTVNGNTATLTWDGGDNASYFVVEYGVNGGNTQTENTSSHQYVIHNLQNANYYWRVKSVCSFGESNFVNGNNIVTGITNHNNEQMLQIYPNPTKDVVNIQLAMNNEQIDGVDIQLFDVYGRLLEVVNMADARGASLKTTQIDLSQYSKGVYFVKAASEGKVIAVRKVVKR